jgi:hypothetical protein
MKSGASRMARMRRGALAALVSGFCLCACVDHEEIAALEAERDAFVAKTVPKDEYWKEVARKGAALRDGRGVQPDVAALEQRAAQARSGIEQFGARIAEASEINGRLEQQLEEQRANERKLAAQAQKLSAFVGSAGEEVQ